MVERRPPSTTAIHGGYDEQPPPVFPSETYESIYISTSDEQETYIIQIPKDQIFSIPPPENSIVAERYRNPENKENRQCKRLSCFLATLIAIGALVGIIFGTIHVFFNPKVPSFSIHNVSILHNKKNVDFEIKLKAMNENGIFRNIYGGDGDAILLHNGDKIGKGKFPGIDQDAGSSTNFQLILDGLLNGKFSKEIEKSIKDESGKRHVALRLEMNNVAVKMKIWKKVMNVVCKFKISSLGERGQNIISQQCKSNFN